MQSDSVANKNQNDPIAAVRAALSAAVLACDDDLARQLWAILHRTPGAAAKGATFTAVGLRLHVA